MYGTVKELRVLCGYDDDDTTISETAGEDALVYAKGVIDEFCNTQFEDPTEDGEDIEYLLDGNGTPALFAPDDGPFHTVSTIEYYDGAAWQAYDDDYWVKAKGEYVRLAWKTTRGDQNWRVNGSCWTELSTHKQKMLERAALLIARLVVIPRDEPLGPSVRSMSMDGASYSYQIVDQAHPTGIDEVDHALVALRRTITRT